MAHPIEMSFLAPRARQARLLILAIAVALTATGVAGLRIITPTPSAATVFKQAQEFAKSHSTANFEGTMTTILPEEFDDELATGAGASAEPGESMSHSAHMSGAFDTKVGSRTVTASNDGVEEVLVVGKASYWRWADSEAELANELFIKETFDDDGIAALAGTFDFAGAAPTGDGLSDMLDVGVDPVIVRRQSDATVIRVTLDGQKLFGLMGKKLDIEMTMTLTVAHDATLREVRSVTEFMKAKSDATVTFSDWGKPVDLTAPDAAQIDPSPDVDEDELQAWTIAPLYVPRAIPAGWELTWSEVISAEDSAEDCEQVELDFEAPGTEEDEEAPYLYLFQMATSCADEFPGRQPEPFHTGGLVGEIETDEDGYSLLQVRIDDRTTLQADSNLPVADLVRILGDLRPFALPLSFETL